MRKELKIIGSRDRHVFTASFTVIGLVISVSDEWQEMGDKIIDKL